MKFADYLKIQAKFVKNEYLRDYDVRDYPAVSYASWKDADEQLKVANSVNENLLSWVEPTADDDKWRVLRLGDEGFFQFWVRQDAKGYRQMAREFLVRHYRVRDILGWQLDHVIPRSRFANKASDGVTVGYFIRGSVNSSWGAGYERSSKGRRLKIRNGVTLITVAKSLGIRGPAISKGRTVEDIADELVGESIISKMYENAAFASYSPRDKVASELRLAMNCDTDSLEAH